MMHGIDYLGPQGGALAMAFAAGVVTAGGSLITAGLMIWRLLFNPRLKELRDQIEAEREHHERVVAAERERHAEEMQRLRDRVLQLETILLANGPASLRQAMQNAMPPTVAAQDD